MSTENHDGEFLIAVQNIERVMKRAKTCEDAVQLYWSRGHSAFEEFWPMTRY